MSTLAVIALILGVIGILGAVVPGLPGPPFSWIGLLLVFLDKSVEPVSTAALVIWLVVVIIVTILDYVVPGLLTKAVGGHKAAGIGATIGLFAGLFFTPVGMIAGSIIGAFLAEFLVTDGGVWSSFKASLGAFIGFIATTVMKLTVCGMLFVKILTTIF